MRWRKCENSSALASQSSATTIISWLIRPTRPATGNSRCRYFDLFARHAAVSERENGLECIRVIDLSTKQSHAIDLPEPAYELSIDNKPEFETATLRFRYQSLVSLSS